MSSPPTHLALIGMAGVGKSAVGARLARRLRRPWVDLDRRIEQAAGRRVAAIIAEDGEAAFRAAESAALAAALVADTASVVSTGGGVVLDAGNRRLLHEHATIVWLRADDATLAARVRASRTVRPLLAGDVEARVATLSEQRRPLYQELAQIVIDTSTIDADRVVEHVLDALRERAAVAPSAGDGP